MTRAYGGAQRSSLLTTVIIIVAVLSVLGIVLTVFGAALLSSRGEGIAGLALLIIAVQIVALLALIGIWRMRRWAVYTYGVLSLLGLIASLGEDVSVGTLLRLALLGLLGYAVSQQWQDFR